MTNDTQKTAVEGPFDSDELVHGEVEEKAEEGKKKKKKGKNGGEDSVNVELKWHNELLSSREYAVYTDSEGFPILYYWVKNQNRWRVVKGDHIIDKHVRQFILKNYRSSYANSKVKACIDSTTNIVYGSGIHLTKETEKSLIDTRNHLIEVTSGGQVVRHEKKNKMPRIYRNFVDVGLKFSDFDEQTGYYMPRDQVEIESSTLWGKLVTDAFPVESDRRIFQEFMGDLLSPTMRKAFPILVGEKNSGKSQILDVISGVLTDAKAGDMSNLSGFQMSPFIGCSTIIVDEMGKRIDEKMVKRIVGGSLIPVERKYKETISIKPDFKVFGGVNEMPTIAEKSGALESRFYLLPVKLHKGKKIDEMAKKICEGYIEHRDGVSVMHGSEIKDVMDWAIQGLQRVMKRGRLLTHKEMSGEAKSMMEGMLKESNPCLDFIEEYGIVPSSGTCFVPKSDVHSLFSKWAAERGRTGLARISINIWSRDMFNPAMMHIHPGLYETESDKRKQITTTRGKRRVECFAVRVTGTTEISHIEEDIANVFTSSNLGHGNGGGKDGVAKNGIALHNPASATVSEEIYWKMDDDI